MSPFPTGNLVLISWVSSDSVGRKQLMTFLSKGATATNTNIEMKACMKSINCSQYSAATSGEGVAEPWVVANPYFLFLSLKLSVKLSRKHDTPQGVTSAAFMIWLTMSHLPCLVRTCERSWQARTDPVGKRSAKCPNEQWSEKSGYWLSVLVFSSVSVMCCRRACLNSS